MKMIMEYRFKQIAAVLILVFGISILVSAQLPKGFEQHISEAPNDSTRLELTKQYIAQTDDLDELRVLQNFWLKLDNLNCISYFEGLQKKNSKDPKYYYLWARTNQGTKFRLKAGRKLVKEYPRFEPGYQMLLGYYQQELFTTADSNHPAAQPHLKDYKKDKKLFQTYLKRFPNSESAMYLAVQQMIWEKQITVANRLVAKALEKNMSWLTWQFYTDYYLRTNQLELLQVYLRRLIDDSEKAKQMTPQQKEATFEDAYINILMLGETYPLVLEFFETHPWMFSNVNFNREYLKACAQLGEMDKAFNLLDNELLRTTDWYDWLTEEESLSALRQDPRWETRLAMFKKISEDKKK